MTPDHHPHHGDESGPLPFTSSDAGALEALIDATADGLALLSRDGRIVRVNEAATRLLGVDRRQLLGRSAGDVDIALTSDGVWIREALTTSDAVSRVVDLSSGGKALVTVRAWRSTEGEAPYLILLLRDVTGVGELVKTVTPTPTSGGRSWQVRRNDVGIDRVVMESRAMRAVAEKALQFAQVESPVLIVGETGTGKTLFSRIIHRASMRAAAPLREVNCGAIPAGLIESELFGYMRGAFTGADTKGRTGLVELADRGTLLLDEIGDMPVLLQVKLLQFLEAGEVWPIGASKPRQVDVRVIAATNADLSAMVTQGGFRRDLFYRLNVLALHVPPLREHPDDIPALIDMMADVLAGRTGRRMRISPDALAMLTRYSFPGNIRELWNIVERLAVSCQRDIVDVPDLPAEVSQAVLVSSVPNGRTNLRQLLRKVEAGIIRDALERYGTQMKAARHLGVGQATIARKARLLDIRGDSAVSNSG